MVKIPLLPPHRNKVWCRSEEGECLMRCLGSKSDLYSQRAQLSLIHLVIKHHQMEMA